MINNFLVVGWLVMFVLLFGGSLMAENPSKLYFAYKFKEGQKLPYRVSVRGQVSVETPKGPQVTPIAIEMEVIQTVLGVENGVSNVSMLVKSAKTFNGSESAPLPEEGQRTLMTVSASGKVTYRSGVGAGSGSEFAQMVFPDHPLSIGESWFSESVQQGTQLKTKTKYTFLKIEDFRSQKCAVFETELSLASANRNPTNPNAQSKGKIFFNPELGQIIEAIGDSSFTFSMPLPTDDNVSVTTKTAIHSEMSLILGN